MTLSATMSVQTIKPSVGGGQPTIKQQQTVHRYTNRPHIQFSKIKNNKNDHIVEFTSILKACACLEALQQGKQIHAYIIKCGFDSDLFVGTLLVDMYARCQTVEDARHLFDRMLQRNRVSWNMMISGYSQNGRVHEALKVFSQMQLAGEKPNIYSWTAIISGYAKNGCWNEVLNFFCQMQLANVEPNAVVISSSLQACARLEALGKGRQIHGFIIKKGLDSDVFMGTALVDMYSKCSSMENACQVFDKMPQRNVVSLNAMIAGFVQNGLLSDALELFDQMLLADTKPNMITWSTLIAGCAQNADCDKALKLLSDMQLKGLKPGVISWTAVITGYAQNGHGKDALKVFHAMLQSGVKPNSNTIAVVLRACTDIADLQQGKSVHGYVMRRGFESNVFVGCALVDMHAKCGSINDAHLVFHQMSEKNVVTWNSIIAGYALKGHVDDAMRLFSRMRLEGMRPDAITWSVMISGYAQNGQADEASKLFSQMRLEGIKPSVISCTAVIAGYAQNGQGDKALRLFNQMQMTGFKPDKVSIVTILPACASLAVLEQGKQIHAYLIRNEFDSDVVVGTALVDMYAKCGSIEDACQIFNKLPERNIVTWNSMITGYAHHGNTKDALSLFHQMSQKGIKPDSITFTGVLSACSRSVLLDEGWKYFDSMSQDYGITPKLEHYACMVDLLGRGGDLDKAWNFIENMPLESNASIWGTLLSACKSHLNVELAERAATYLFQLEPDNTANYVLLSNIYALAGRWDDIRSLRKMMKDMGVKKRLGWSWIWVKNEMHTFFVGDCPLSNG